MSQEKKFVTNGEVTTEMNGLKKFESKSWKIKHMFSIHLKVSLTRIISVKANELPLIAFSISSAIYIIIYNLLNTKLHSDIQKHAPIYTVIPYNYPWEFALVFKLYVLKVSPLCRTINLKYIRRRIKLRRVNWSHQNIHLCLVSCYALLPTLYQKMSLLLSYHSRLLTKGTL